METRKLETVTLNNVTEITLETGHKIYLSDGIYPDFLGREFAFNEDKTIDRIMRDNMEAIIDDTDNPLYESVEINIRVEYEPLVLC